MEKAIVFIFCFSLFVSCSETEKSEPKKSDNKTVDKSEPKGLCSNLTDNEKRNTILPQTVHWMYMDDSLKNICRPLNFQLPWMESDIKMIPEIITPEILNLSPIKTFEIVEKTKGFVDDSLFYFYFALERDFCHCEVYRFYKGIASDKKFTGYEITEQVICNANSGITGLSPSASLGEDAIEKENDSTKYEMHGHEH